MEFEHTPNVLGVSGGRKRTVGAALHEPPLVGILFAEPEAVIT